MKKIIALLFVQAYISGLYLAVAQQFTLPIIPDSQVSVGQKPDMFFSQMDWLVNNRDKLNIPFVLHVGDLVNFDNFEHYENASIGLDKLDKHQIPYAIAVGNHDTEAVGEYSGSAAPGNVNQNLRKTNKFNSYLPTSRFQNLRGVYEDNKIYNSYYTFKVGKTNWLVISLEFCPRQGAINWANEIAEKYHAYNIILLTHYYLTPDGKIADRNAGYGDFSPLDIFEKLVKKQKNIKFVVSGHVVSSAYKIDKLENGNTVYQLLQDYQHEDSGGGYIRLLKFDVDKGIVQAEMYSPFYDKVKLDSSKFTLEGIEFLKVEN